MNWIDVLLLIILFTTSVTCAVTDIRQHIVKNKVVLIALCCAIVLQIANAVFYGSQGYSYWIINCTVSIGIAVLMYAGGLWAAGDVKLFSVLALCFPVILIEENYNESILPYVFIFIPAFVYLIIDTFCQKSEHKEFFQQAQSKWNWQRILDFILLSIEITALQTVIRLVLGEASEDHALLLSAISMIAAYIYSTKEIVRKLPFIAINVFLELGCLVFQKWQLGFIDWRIYVIIAIVIFCQHKIEPYNYQRIPTSTVQSGMILSAGTVLSFNVSRVKGLPSNASESMKSRITKEEALAIQKWETSAHGQPTIVIVRKIPFAGFVALGYLLLSVVKVVLFNI